jgi:hypothetical protein
MFFLQQNWRTRGRNMFCLEVGGVGEWGMEGGGIWGVEEEVAQLCTHVNKCKNDKIKGERKNKTPYHTFPLNKKKKKALWL